MKSNSFLKAAGATALTFALAATVAPALAASGPSFSAAKPWSGMDVESFRSDVNTFNRNEVSDLLAASHVSVVRVDSAWNDSKDSGRAFNAVQRSDQAIHLLRMALKDDAAAAKLLKANGIDVNRVVDITAIADGAVQLYIS